jgi:hypothetical protein
VEARTVRSIFGGKDDLLWHLVQVITRVLFCS